MEQKKPITAENAAAVWRRAAQLQAEAAQKLEERSRALSASAAANDADVHDFTMDEVRSAAEEVGIAPEFVALAIAEQRADPVGALPPKLQDKASWFLGTEARMMEVSRTIDRPMAEVYSAMQLVLPGQPWNLTLRDITGDPLAGGILLFNIPEISYLGLSSSAEMTPLAYNALALDIQQLQVLLRPVGSDDRACEVIVRAGLQRSIRRNFKVGRWLTGAAGIGGSAFGAGAAAVAGVAGAVLLVPAVAVGAVVGGASVVGYRALYRGYFNKFSTVLEDMLGSIAVHVKTGGGFAPVARMNQSKQLPNNTGHTPDA